MNWFGRHLNWSFFLGVWLLPSIIGIILNLIFMPQLSTNLADLATSGASEEEIMRYIFSLYMQIMPMYFIAGLVLLIIAILITYWYLGRKARNKWLTLLLFAPFGIIILLVLNNKSTGYGGDFAYETQTIGSTGGGYGISGYDERQLKELDYTPSQNVLDISGVQAAKDIYSMGELSDTGSGAGESAGEEIPPDMTTQRPMTHERPSMPILLGDDGNVISCAYHPGADAVNLCSRCHQYVCVECNYVTGTHPICRNCWGRKTEVPLAPSPQKQAKSAPSKPVEQQETDEPSMRVKQENSIPAEPEVAPVPEAAEPTEEILYESVSQQVSEREVQLEQEAVTPPKAEEPPAEAAVKPEEPQDIAAVEPEEPVILTPIKPTKRDAETVKWQQEFMTIYQQASPIINIIIRKGADGMPGSPLDLMEGLKLRPMLALAKKLSKPKDKEQRQAKSELEDLLSICIKIADGAADFVGGGGHAMLGGPGFKRIVDGIEKASALMEKLSPRLQNFYRPQE
jgi:hypothetical protein